MRRVVRSLKFFLLVSLLTLGTISGLAAQEITYTGPPITLRMSTHAPTTHMIYRATLIPFMEQTEKESKGKLIIKPFPSASLHGPRDGFKACAADITDYTHGYPSWHAGSFQLNHVLELPFAFPNAYVASIVSEELYPKYFKKEYEKMGVYLADYHTTSTYNILSKKPVRKLEDLKGMKVRSGGGFVARIFKSLGAAPVVMPSAEAYSAFQRGMVDAMLFSNSDQVSYRIHELGKYLTLLDVNVAPVPYCLNRKTFDNLPPDLKRLLYNLLRQMSQKSAAGYEEEGEKAQDVMVKSGIEVVTLPPKEFERWRAAVEPLGEEFTSKYEAEGLPAKQLVKDLRALSQKYSTWTPEQLLKQVREHPTAGIIDGM